MSPDFGLTRIGGFVRYCLIAVNARSHSSFHSARLAPLRVAKKGFKRSVNREIKRPRAANRPISCWIPFLELGANDCKMALSYAGLASIPLWVTIKPRNRPALTPKAHFKGFSFIPYSLSRMSVEDVQRDPGAAWILPAYHQYRLPLCYRVMVETSSSPTSDRWLLHSLSRKASHCNSSPWGVMKDVFSASKGCMGIW